MERKAIYLKGHVTLPELEAFLIDTTPEDSGVTDIVIGGSLLEHLDARCNYTVKVPTNLWVLQDIVTCSGGTIKVDGDLFCAGNIDSYSFIVKGDLTCEGNANITDTEVGGDSVFKGNIRAYGTKIKSLGDFTCYGDCSADVFVGGSFLVEGEFTGEVAKA